MPIVTPGKRPGERLAKSKVFGKKFGRGKKNPYAALQLTSLVDVMTMIVIFLLANFNANGEILFMSKDIRLPEAHHGAEIERAPVVSLSAETLSLDGTRVADSGELEKGDVWNVPALEEALRDEKRKYEQAHQGDDKPFRGVVNIQADRKVQFKVIKRVMFSCNQAGYGNLNFAALSKGSEAPQPAAAKP